MIKGREQPMSDRLTAEPGTLKFLTIHIPIMGAEELIADTLNWFEDGQLMIGSKDNPEHVEAWREWNKTMGVEVSHVP